MRTAIAHLSDPHFGTIYPEVMEALQARLKQLSPSLIVISGDITQRARHSQFQQARNFVTSIQPQPVIAIPGNHDIPLFNLPARLLFPYYGFQKIFKGLLSHQHTLRDVQVIALNSTNRFRHVQGHFPIPQLESHLQGLLSPAQVRIVTFHHPMDCRRDGDKLNLLRNHNEALPVFEKADVDLILGGHIHDPFVSLSVERYPSTKKSMVFSVAGTCLSWRIRKDAPNSFHWIEIETERADSPHMRITRYDHLQGEFKAVNQRQFQRTPGIGWQNQT